MISEVGAYATIISIAGCGIAFAVFIVFKNGLHKSVDQSLDEFFQQRDAEYLGISDSAPLMDQQAANPGYSQSLKLYYSGVAKQIQDCSFELFKQQTFLMLFFAMIFALGFLIWLANEDRSILLLISFTTGCLCMTLNSFITLKLSAVTAIKTAILPVTESILTYTYFTAAAISILTTSITLLALSIIVPIYINQLKDSEQNSAGYTAIFSSVLGFGLGATYATLFYREAGGMSAKGILVGRDMISRQGYKSQDQTVIEVNLNTASIVSNVYNNNITSVLDFQSIFTGFLCTYMLCLAQSSSAVKEENHPVFYLPLFFVALNMVFFGFISFITEFAPAENVADASVPQSTSNHVRLQMLIGNIGSLVFILLVPVFFVPEKFSIGETEKSTVNNKDIDPSDAVWALVTGLLAQTILIVYSEYQTSHYYKPVQKIAAAKSTNTKGGFSLTMLAATENANITQFPIFILFSSAIIVGYLLAGFFGVACCIVGLIAAPFSMVSINVFSGLVQQAFEVAGICYIRQMRQRLFSYSWASRNFSIYPQIVSLLAVILTSVLGIGACVTIAKKQEIYVWDAYGIFGFLLGGSLAYFIKGIGLSGIKAVAEALKEGYFEKRQNKDYKTNLREVDFMVQGHYKTVIVKVAVNIFLCLLCIVLIGIFLGVESLLSFVIGLNMVGIYLCFNSLIIGYSVKNAHDGQVTNLDDGTIQADITVSATEGVPGTALLPYLIFTTLFVLQGASKWGSYGFFRKWVDAGSFNKLADSTTDSYLDLVKNAFDSSSSGATSTPTPVAEEAAATTDAPAF